MKKLIFALILGLLVILASASIAMADNGPHGGFSATTDSCAGCHRAHTAKGPTYLLVASDIETLCFSCHDGTGAYTDVVNGIYTKTAWVTTDHGTAPGVTQGDQSVGLFGGGFMFARMSFTNGASNSAYQNGYDLASTAPVAAPVTSKHTTNGGTGTVWGSGALNSTAGTMALYCTSCHDPHGGAGRAGNVPTGAPQASYRILRFAPDGSNGFEAPTTHGTATFWSNTASTAGVNVADLGTKWYTINADFSIDPSVQFWRARIVGGVPTTFTAYIQGRGDYAGRAYNYQRPAIVSETTASQILSCADGTGKPTNPATACGANTGTPFNNTSILPSLSQWCATCHDRYLATNSQGRSVASADTTYMYRHTSGSTSAQCVYCHVAHGTSAVMSGQAQAATLSPIGATPANNSVLLKMDSRSICLDCHGTGVNFFGAP